MTAAPQAQVVAVHGRFIDVRCPYCGRTHRHAVIALGHAERFAPGCGLYLSGDKRATGYRFHTRGLNDDRH